MWQKGVWMCISRSSWSWAQTYFTVTRATAAVHAYHEHYKQTISVFKCSIRDTTKRNQPGIELVSHLIGLNHTAIKVNQPLYVPFPDAKSWLRDVPDAEDSIISSWSSSFAANVTFAPWYTVRLMEGWPVDESFPNVLAVVSFSDARNVKVPIKWRADDVTFCFDVFGSDVVNSVSMLEIVVGVSE